MDCRFVVLGCLTLSPACFSEPPSGQTGSGSTGATATSSTGGEASTSVGEASSSTTVDSATDPTSGPTGDSSSSGTVCESQMYDLVGRRAPVDLLLVLDSSQSMVSQAGAVQGVLDELYADFISVLGTDALRIVVATALANPYDWCLGAVDPIGDCVSRDFAPLDVDFSGRPVEPFGSFVTALIDEPVAALRPTSQKHVVLMTAGDTARGQAVSLTQLRLQPGFLHTRVHTFAGGPESSGCLGVAANAEVLSMQTGGISGSLCPVDAGPLIDSLLTPRASCTFPLSDGADLGAVTSATLVGGPGEVGIEIADTVAGCAGLGAAAIRSGPGEPLALSLCPDTCRAYQDATTDAARTMLRVFYEVCE